MNRPIRELTARTIPILFLLLTACQGVFEVRLESEEQPAPTTVTGAAMEPTPSVVAPSPTLEEQAPSTLAPSPIASEPPDLEATQTPAPLSPSSTPSPTSTPKPTSTPAPPRPVIVSFVATPSEAVPGDTVTLSWQASGDRAKICPTARFTLFTEADCRQVPLSGTSAFTIPSAASDFQYVDFVLTAEMGSPAATSTAQVSVALKCDDTWFYSGEPRAGICPLKPLRTYAAAQHFERGLMVWLETPGRYYIFVEELLYVGEARKRLDVIDDPLIITGDTSQGLEAPPGLHAPVSGFGLVWRGDIEQSSGHRQLLGWALEPESGYEAILQCDNALPSGGQTWQTCYLKGPGGEIFGLHPLGGWYILTE